MERATIAGPHVAGELQQLLEAHEPLGGGLERQPGHRGLVGLVAGPDAEPRPPTGEHVERGDHLDDQGWRPDQRPHDHGAEANRTGRRGQKPEGRVHLEHRFVDRRVRIHLQEVIGDPHRIQPGAVDSVGELDQSGGQAGGIVSPGVVGDGDAQLHVGTMKLYWMPAIRGSPLPATITKDTRVSVGTGLPRASPLACWWATTTAVSL